MLSRSKSWIKEAFAPVFGSLIKIIKLYQEDFECLINLLEGNPIWKKRTGNFKSY